MFDFSISEISLISIVALILLGPEELPTIIKTFRNISKKSRTMFTEFTDSIIKMEEVKDLKQEVQKLNSDLNQMNLNKITGDDGNLYETYDVDEVLKDLHAINPNKIENPQLNNNNNPQLQNPAPSAIINKINKIE